MQKKKNIIFDVDGTLVDSIGIILDCFKKTFYEMSYDYVGDKKIKRLIGTDLHDIFRIFFDENETIKAVQIYRNFYLKKQEKGIPPCKGAENLLKKLSENDKKIGAFTMKLAQYARPLLKELKIDNYFEVIIGAEDVKYGKPHPEGLEKTMHLMNGKGTETVYIGDSLHDAECAREAGIDFIAVTTGSAEKKEFENLNIKYIFNDLDEVSDFITV